MQIYIVFSVFATKNTKICIFERKIFYNVTILAIFVRFCQQLYIISELFFIFASRYFNRYFLFVSHLINIAEGVIPTSHPLIMVSFFK